jgi:hypothetical protein
VPDAIAVESDIRVAVGARRGEDGMRECALARGRVVAAPWSLVSRYALPLVLFSGLLGGLVPGCFYADPINQRPSLEIVNTSSEEVHRGDVVRLSALWDDPDGHFVTVRWRVYACTDATRPEACDPAPFEESSSSLLELVVPMQRVQPVVPVESLRVVLEASDEWGATARPSQELVIPVVNRPPTVELERSSRYKYVAGAPIRLFAKVGDLDDGVAGLRPLAWEVFGPAQTSYTLEDDPDFVEGVEDPHFLHAAKVFTPDGPGEWMVRVTATDALGAQDRETMEITVVTDGPPCLAQVSPIVPPGGVTLPIATPTLFRVPIVIDDLDVYPPQPADPVLGTATFQWSMRGPGQSAHVPIAGATGNTFAFDPAAYALGDVVEVRVQIYDRNETPIPCVDSEATCSVISTPSCIQRQTWRVEVR